MRDYVLELKGILFSNADIEQKRDQILQYHANDIAELLDELEKEDRTKLYEILGNEEVAEILSYSENICEIVEELDINQAADIIELMDSDDAVDVLEELDDETREEIVELIDKEVLEDIQEIINYSDEEIGSKMTNNYISILNTDSIKIATKKLINDAAENDNISVIYVVDQNNKYYGAIELRDLIIARDTANIDDIIMKAYPYFLANTLIEDCINELKDYALDSYPILNIENELIGVITADDVVEAVDEELSDDYAKLAGLTESEELNDSVFQSVKKRLPWLIVLLILGLAQSFAMTGFEAVVAAIPVIVFFQTLVLSMSGNSGTQSLAVTIRMLSDSLDSKKQIAKVAFKELRTGFLNGLVLGALAFGIVFAYMLISRQSIETESFQILDAIKTSGIVAISLLVAMTLSSCVGTLIPIIFLKLKVDPAVASGPFITTISDVTALLIYYGLAYLLFLAF